MRGGGVRLKLAAACTLAFVGVPGTTARADAFGLAFSAWRASADAPAIAQGWAWQAQRNAAPSLGPVSTIPSGDLAVAWLGQPDKISFLGIGGAGSRSLAGATLELAMDPDAPNLEAEGAEIGACLIVSEWEPAAPMAWDTKPSTVCDTPVPGRFEASAGVFAFDLDPLTDALASAAVHGISIEPVESPASSFQVVFKEGVRLKLAAPQSVPTTEGPAPAPAPDPVVEGEDLAAYAPAEPLPDRSTATRATPTPSTGVAAASAPDTDARTVNLSAVYAMLALLAGLALGGRVVVYMLRSKREDET